MEVEFEKFFTQLQVKVKEEYGKDVFENPKVTNFENSRSAELIYRFNLETERIKKIISKSIIKIYKTRLQG